MVLNRLLKITLVFTFIVILMGAYTRLSDAGLGCPDWPGCYGQLKVPTQSHEIAKAQQAFPERALEQDKAWLEMIHRYIAGTLGLLVLLIFYLSLKSQDSPKKLPAAIVLLIIFQAALGMWTVTMKLMPIVVMAHLIGGFSLFALLLLLHLRRQKLEIAIHDTYLRSLAPLASISLVVLLIQIILGGWTSSNYAALSCSLLPICEGDWISRLNFATAFNPFQGEHASYEFGVLEYDARMTIHVVHRIWAIVTLATLGLLAFKLLKQAHTKLIKQSAWLLIILLTLQFSLGLSNVIFHLPLKVAVAHNGGAALLMLNLVFINYILWRKVKPNRLL